MGLAEVVLNTGFKPSRQARLNSGKMGERWSSIGTTMARKTRSGTLLGPGTNRKLRPAIRLSFCDNSTPGLEPMIYEISWALAGCIRGGDHANCHRGAKRLRQGGARG